VSERERLKSISALLRQGKRVLTVERDTTTEKIRGKNEAYLFYKEIRGGVERRDSRLLA